MKLTGCVKTKLTSLQICQVKHYPCAVIPLRMSKACLHLISFCSRFGLFIPAKDEKYVKVLNDLFFFSTENRKMCIAGVRLSRSG